MRLFIATMAVLFVSSSVFAGSEAAQPGTSHLEFANGSIHAHAHWLQGPLVEGESIISLEWKNGVDQTATEPPGAFKVSIFMPSMGHGSSPTQIERVLGSDGKPLVGAYRVTAMYFTMAGDWEVKVTIRYADGKEETKKFKVRL